MFHEGEADFEQLTYRSLERSPQIALDAGYSAQPLVLPSHFGKGIFGHFWIFFFGKLHWFPYLGWSYF